MRYLKAIGFFLVLSSIFTSCNTATENVVYYSKDELKNNLVVNVNDSDGVLIPVKSKTTLSLMSSSFFQENLIYLKDIYVTKLCYKVKNFTPNSSVFLSNIRLFLDEMPITNYMTPNLLKTTNNNVEFIITNQELLSNIASKLLNKKEVVVSFESDAISSSQLNFDVEFSITAKGVFVD